RRADDGLRRSRGGHGTEGILVAAEAVQHRSVVGGLDHRCTEQAQTRASVRNADTERSVDPHVRKHAGPSGVLALRDGRDAFAVRMQLADAAVRKLDCQYYIWRNDLS